MDVKKDEKKIIFKVGGRAGFSPCWRWLRNREGEAAGGGGLLGRQAGDPARRGSLGGRRAGRGCGRGGPAPCAERTESPPRATGVRHPRRPRGAGGFATAIVWDSREKERNVSKSQGGSHGTVPRTLTKRSARSRAQRRGRWVPPPHSRSAVRVRGGAVKVWRAAFAGRAGTRGGDSQQPGQRAEARGRGKPDRDASSGDGFRGGRRSSRSPGGSRGSSQDDRDERGAETGAPGCGARGSGHPGSRLADPWLSGRVTPSCRRGRGQRHRDSQRKSTRFLPTAAENVRDSARDDGAAC